MRDPLEDEIKWGMWTRDARTGSDIIRGCLENICVQRAISQDARRLARDPAALRAESKRIGAKEMIDHVHKYRDLEKRAADAQFVGAA